MGWRCGACGRARIDADHSVAMHSISAWDSGAALMRAAFTRVNALRSSREMDTRKPTVQNRRVTVSFRRVQNEGRRWEAESEYAGALYELERAGLGNTMDAGAVFNSLGSLYIKEHRLCDARRPLDRTVAISISAADAIP